MFPRRGGPDGETFWNVSPSAGSGMFPRRAGAEMFPRRCDQRVGETFSGMFPRWPGGAKTGAVGAPGAGVDAAGVDAADGETFKDVSPLALHFAAPTGKHLKMFPECFPVGPIWQISLHMGGGTASYRHS